MSKYDPLHAITLIIFICKLHYWQMNHKGHLLNKRCLTQLSGKYLSTISLILACWVCSMEGLK